MINESKGIKNVQNSLTEECGRKAADISNQKLIQSVISLEAKGTAQKYCSQVNKVVSHEVTG